MVPPLEEELVAAALPFVADGGRLLDLGGGLSKTGLAGERIGLETGTPTLAAAAYDIVAVLDLPAIDPIGLLRAALRALKPAGRLVVAGRSDLPGGYSCSAEGMEALLKHLGCARTLAARPDLCGGKAYLVAALK